MIDVIDLAKQLIAIASVTPKDLGCQTLLLQHLRRLEFDCQLLPNQEISNFWAKRGTAAPLFVFAGHTDVVPAGPLEAWDSDPFQPAIHDGKLYGRGAADMKGALAAMLVATERFISDYPKHSGSIGFLITSAEEGPADEGTPFVLQHLAQQQQHIDWCVVGEASATQQCGDTIKNGRRGSLTGQLTIIGKQGHVAYPELANNPIHQATAALQQLTNTVWDQGNTYFPPTSLQISNIHSGTGAGNVIPGHMDVLFNFRFSPECKPDDLQQQVETILQQHQLKYQLDWHLFGMPYLTTDQAFLTVCQQAVSEVCGIQPRLATDGGTSDGRYIAKDNTQVVEIGPSNRTIHQVNEHIAVADLQQLCDVYYTILTKLLMR